MTLDLCAAAPPAEGPALQVDAAALRENLASFAGQAANTAGQAANTVRQVLWLPALPGLLRCMQKRWSH